MSSCENMKVGEVYECKACGLEIEVKKACDCVNDKCEPVADDHCCDFNCCGKPMELKK